VLGVLAGAEEGTAAGFDARGPVRASDGHGQKSLQGIVGRLPTSGPDPGLDELVEHPRLEERDLVGDLARRGECLRVSAETVVEDRACEAGDLQGIPVVPMFDELRVDH
jgi:hypothetical protein